MVLIRFFGGRCSKGDLVPGSGIVDAPLESPSDIATTIERDPAALNSQDLKA
jgi:hypothetical protein